MTTEELEQFEREYPPDGAVHCLVAEVRRLRALIADAESDTDERCPWCNTWMPSGSKNRETIQHRGTCPAFHTDGCLR